MSMSSDNRVFRIIPVLPEGRSGGNDVKPSTRIHGNDNQFDPFDSIKQEAQRIANQRAKKAPLPEKKDSSIKGRLRRNKDDEQHR